MAVWELPACALAYSQGTRVNTPEEGYTLTPWVMVNFIEDYGQPAPKSSITVSNCSSKKWNHTAIIQTFEFGMSDGLTCKISISDQQGSSFVKFMKDLTEDFNKIVPMTEYEVEVQWGWAKAFCDDFVVDRVSEKHYCLIDTIDGTFQSGKFMFDIVCVDIPTRMQEARSEHIKEKMKLKFAITDLLTNGSIEKPVVSCVEFVRAAKPCGSGGVCNNGKNTDKAKVPAGFWHGGCDGPEANWPSQGSSKLQTAKTWLEWYPTDNRKGWKANYDSTTHTMTYWEDPTPKCHESNQFFHHETLVVNGGALSRVIEFNPHFRYSTANLVSMGGHSGAKQPFPNQKDTKSEGRFECGSNPPKRTGAEPTGPASNNLGNSISDQIRDNEGPTGQLEQARNQALSQRINHTYAMDISATCVVQGDPDICSPLEISTKTFAIVFINPFHISGGSAETCGTDKYPGCGDWLADPKCNAVLSHRAWRVSGVCHKISPGRYVTQLELWLVASGIDIELCDDIGGQGAEGWNPCYGQDY